MSFFAAPRRSHLRPGAFQFTFDAAADPFPACRSCFDCHGPAPAGAGPRM